MRMLGIIILISLCLWGIIIGLVILGIRSCRSCRKGDVQSISQYRFYEVGVPVVDERVLLLKSDGARAGVIDCGKNLSGYVADPIGFILAIACLESDFGRRVDGKNGEIGVMQIHPYWLKRYDLKRSDLEDDYVNVCFAVDLMKEYFEKYNDVFLVMKVYNRGERALWKNHNEVYLRRFFKCAEKVSWQNVDKRFNFEYFLKK
jgi:hypothetical protein